MSFPDIVPELAARLPDLRGRLAANQTLADITWFRVGGPAQVLFLPADAHDLAYVLAHIPADLPVTVIGLGSNLLVRDGGIPGCIGGALRMNAGAHGRETKDVLIEAEAVDRRGKLHRLTLTDMGMTYRHSGVPDTFIFTEALYQGSPGDPAEILSEMQAVADYREAHQPIKERTGGSTFKNPPGSSAWKLVDAAGCRGLRVGGAKVSEMHCNFLINDANASAEDIERLGETVRARVKAQSGQTLTWEIVRLGVPLPGRPTGEALAT